jgi:hypothetical protein
MKVQKQRFRHNPSAGVYGDCHRTAIACMLDLDAEQVPHFGEGGPEAVEFHARVGDFLKGMDLRAVNVIFACSLAEVLEHQKAMNPGVLYLLGGTSRNGTGHTVVGCGGEIVCDPSIDDSGIVGPMDDGFIWITYLIPASFCAEQPLAKAA